VLDLYPTQNKTASNVEYGRNFVSGRNVFAKISLCMKLLKKQDYRIIHFHFSQLSILAVCVTALSFGNASIFITLHHGRLSKSFFFPGLSKIFYKIYFKNINKIFALSDEQERFYLDIGIAKNKIIRFEINPIYPKLTSWSSDFEASKFLSRLFLSDRRVVVTSGMCKKLYGYDVSLDLVRALSLKISCQLVICVYGDEFDNDYMTHIRRRVKSESNVCLLEGVSRDDFLYLLRHADLYVRPTSVDSYGIAITEALDLGCPCLASDVCGRDARAVTYAAGRTDLLLKMASDILLGNSDKRKCQGKLDEEAYNVFVKRLFDACDI
jgi:glycosyltransferase involved in cell wall biosynthesis